MKSAFIVTLFHRVVISSHQLGRKFPDIGRVKVDNFGNIVGGVNPFEGTDIKLEDQPKPSDDEEVGTAVVSMFKMHAPVDIPPLNIFLFEGESALNNQHHRLSVPDGVVTKCWWGDGISLELSFHLCETQTERLRLSIGV